MELIERGRDHLSDRRLFTLALSSPSEMPERIEVPSKHFVCLVAWDSRNASVHEIVRLITPLLESGASYFVCWGPDCERVHDVIDETLTGPDSPIVEPDDSCIMTTWHAQEPLEEALFFLLTSASPDAHYEKLTQAVIGVSIGSDVWATEIASALSDTHAFLQSTSDAGAA